MSRDIELNRLTEQIIGAAVEVHRHLGPGLLEPAYESGVICLSVNLCVAMLRVGAVNCE